MTCKLKGRTSKTATALTGVFAGRGSGPLIADRSVKRKGRPLAALPCEFRVGGATPRC
jgi:hypothetical protein